MSSLLSVKVLIGIVLLGKAHQSIDEHRHTLVTKDVSSQQSQLDLKPMSKDDLDLLYVVRTSPEAVESTPLRRTQSLSQFGSTVDDPVMVRLLVFTQRRSVAKNIGCFRWNLFVCVSVIRCVCWFVCQHDRCIVQSSWPSSNLGVMAPDGVRNPQNVGFCRVAMHDKM